jgi:hypothetical protein
LENGTEVVIAIGPFMQDAKVEIDFGQGAEATGVTDKVFRHAS